MSRRKALAVLAALLLLLGLRTAGRRWLGARGGAGPAGAESPAGGPGDGAGPDGSHASTERRRRYPGIEDTGNWQPWSERAARSPLYGPREEAPEGVPGGDEAGSAGTGPSPESRARRRGRSGLELVYRASTTGTRTSRAAPERLAEISAAPAAGHKAAGGDEAGPSVFQGAADTAPQPNPERPRTPDAPCPKRGWWKSPYTGLCYASRGSCAASDYERRGCFQPNP